jgi:hypothetical protein
MTPHSRRRGHTVIVPRVRHRSPLFIVVGPCVHHPPAFANVVVVVVPRSLLMLMLSLSLSSHVHCPAFVVLPLLSCVHCPAFIVLRSLSCVHCPAFVIPRSLSLSRRCCPPHSSSSFPSCLLSDTPRSIVDSTTISPYEQWLVGGVVVL